MRAKYKQGAIGNANLEGACSLNAQGTQDADVGSVVSISSEELEEVEVGEEVEDYEILENIISDVRELLFFFKWRRTSLFMIELKVLENYTMSVIKKSKEQT